MLKGTHGQALLVIQTVCRALNLEIESVMSHKRNRENAEARFIIFHLLLNHCNWSQRQAAGIMQKHHTTITYGAQVFKDLVQCKNKDFLCKLDIVQEELLKRRISL